MQLQNSEKALVLQGFCEVRETALCSRKKGPIALIGDTSEFDAGAPGEHLGGHLADGARHKAIVDLAGIGLGVGN